MDDSGDGEDLIGVSREAASRVAGVSIARLYAWEDRGLIVPEAGEDAHRYSHLYSFEQLVEIAVVRELSDAGVVLKDLEAFLGHLRSHVGRPLSELRWGVVHPVPSQRRASRGTTARRARPGLYAQFADGSWLGGKHANHGVIDQVLAIDAIRLSLRTKLEQRDGTPGRITRRRGVRHNQDVFAGTRTPVSAVMAFLARGIPDAEILEAYPHLSIEDIAAARQQMVSAS